MRNKNVIKAVVLDIDGVILGDKKGVNFPHPSKRVKDTLRKIHDSGIPVSLLTSKAAFIAYDDIKYLTIDNPHIASNGAVIFNPIRDQIIHVESIKENYLLKILQLLPKNIYINLFGVDKYFLQKSQISEFTNVYTEFAGSNPVLVDNFKSILKKELITKINICAFSEKDIEIISKATKDLSGVFNLVWSASPQLFPAKILVVTKKGISKSSGIKHLARVLKVSLDEILGVGDQLLDWDFIQLCGYKAIMGNAGNELKKKLDLDDSRQMIAGHVDEDGILDVFRYFKLI